MAIEQRIIIIIGSSDHDQTLPHPKADSVWCCERALKRRSSEYGRV